LTKWFLARELQSIRPNKRPGGFALHFAALEDYASKKRNALFVIDAEIEALVAAALKVLEDAPADVAALNAEIFVLVHQAEISEERIRDLLSRLPSEDDAPCFEEARQLLQKALDLVGIRLTAQWENERYVREEIDLSE
jgi:hypothetical protein